MEHRLETLPLIHMKK